MPNTTYHYRIVTTNSFGKPFGADQKFTTSGGPRITTKPPTGIGDETATLSAEVNPDQLDTTYHFEYGETASYGTETPTRRRKHRQRREPCPCHRQPQATSS